MAPRRHDDKRRTAVRTRGAGPREGAVKGPESISLVYRDSLRPATERAGAEREVPRLVFPPVASFLKTFSRGWRTKRSKKRRLLKSLPS